MMAVRILPVVLAFLLLAAHFSRSGLPALSAVSLFFAGLVFVRRRWAARAIQILLLAGAAEWVRTTLFYVGVRKVRVSDAREHEYRSSVNAQIGEREQPFR